MSKEEQGLAARQQALLQAVLARDRSVDGLAPLGGIEGGAARGLEAYRLNAQALSAKALAAVFPRLREWLGSESFDAMAWAFWRHAPPERGDLALWGAGLAGFLAAQDGIEDEALDLARLEWALHEAERAADAALDLASLQLLSTADPAQVGLRLRPGLQVLTAQSAGPVLVWRQGWRGESRPLASGEAALLQALQAGNDLAAALDAGLTAQADFDFGAWLQAALREELLQAACLLDTTTNKDNMP